MHKNFSRFVPVLLFVALLGLAYYYRAEIWGWFNKSQGYANVNDMTGAGTFDNLAPPLNPNETDNALDFADLVDDSNHAKYQTIANLSQSTAMKDLEREFEAARLPKTAQNVTPYNIDVADPKSFSYMANMPRVTIKPKTWEGADPYRGDIPIRFNPNIALVTKSQYDKDSQRTDTMFSDATFEAAERLQQSAYKSMPMQVSLGGVIGDYTQV